MKKYMSGRVEGSAFLAGLIALVLWMAFLMFGVIHDMYFPVAPRYFPAGKHILLFLFFLLYSGYTFIAHIMMHKDTIPPPKNAEIFLRFFLSVTQKDHREVIFLVFSLHFAKSLHRAFFVQTRLFSGFLYRFARSDFLFFQNDQAFRVIHFWK